MNFVIALLICCTFTKCVHASPPACYPGEPSSSAKTAADIDIFATEDGQCAQYSCDVGHRWQMVSICGSDFEAQLAAPLLRAAMSLSHADKDLLWISTFTEPSVPGSADARMLAIAQSRPVPTTVPPSGLVTAHVEVYKLSQSSNAPFTMPLMGTIKLSLPCDTSQSINGLYRVDRSLVKVSSGVLLPQTTWAKCTQ